MIAYANMESNHSYPYEALINNQGDILYVFWGTYLTHVTSSSVYDVIVAEDFKVIFSEYMDQAVILYTTEKKGNEVFSDRNG